MVIEHYKHTLYIYTQRWCRTGCASVLGYAQHATHAAVNTTKTLANTSVLSSPLRYVACGAQPRTGAQHCLQCTQICVFMYVLSNI